MAIHFYLHDCEKKVDIAIASSETVIGRDSILQVCLFIVFLYIHGFELINNNYLIDSVTTSESRVSTAL